jgi:hypothetical protein
VLHVLKHLEQECTLFTGRLAFYSGRLQFVPHGVQLSTQGVHEGTVRGRELTFIVCPRWTSTVFTRWTFMVFTRCCSSVHLNKVDRCPCAFTVDVQEWCDAHKFRIVNHAIRGRTHLPLIDELVEGSTRDTELAGGFGFGESGHGQAS